MEDKYNWFIKKVKELSGIDLTNYKRPQMERRIKSLMQTQGIDNYEAYVKYLTNNKEHYRKFLDHITINVSEFFRNKQNWVVLQEKILPDLLKNFVPLKTWSAGCSTGEEPYTLAITLLEHAAGKFQKIIATDIDRQVLAKAKEGVYPARSVAEVPESLRKKYFSQTDKGFIIKDEVKKWVAFQQQDMLKDDYPTNCDLILCRNVVIYFTEDAKRELYRKFYTALRPGGILFIGSTEQIFQAKELGLQLASTFFYQKV